MKSLFLFCFIIWFADAELKPRKGKTRPCWCLRCPDQTCGAYDKKTSMQMWLKWNDDVMRSTASNALSITLFWRFMVNLVCLILTQKPPKVKWWLLFVLMLILGCSGISAVFACFPPVCITWSCMLLRQNVFDKCFILLYMEIPLFLLVCASAPYAFLNSTL